MKQIYLFTLVALLLVGNACTHEIPFEDKEVAPKLVMNALITPDTLTHRVYLNLTGMNRMTHVKDASLEIRVNGATVEHCRPLPIDPESSSKQCVFAIRTRFAPGDRVRLDAHTDDKQHHAWAELVVPQSPLPILSVDTLTVPLKVGGSESNYLRYRITIKDRPNEINYYRFQLFQEERWTQATGYYDPFTDNYISLGTDASVLRVQRDPRFIFRDDVVLTEGKPLTDVDEENGLFESVKNVYTVFDDSRFLNTSHTLTVYNRSNVTVPGYGNDYRKEVVIRLQSIGEAAYRYFKALNLYRSDTVEEALSEPIKYPSNVQGGTGFVGIFSEVEYRLSLTIP